MNNMNKMTSFNAYGYAFLAGARAVDYDWLARLAANPISLKAMSASVRELAIRDLALIRAIAQQKGLHSKPTVERLNVAYATALDVYKTLGFKVADLPLRVQKEFPRPYSDTDLWGLILDRQDGRELGVAPGIYVRRSKAFPGIGEATVCHELVHTLFSFVESEALVRGYEEGVCDLISSVALAKLYGWRWAADILIALRIFVEERRDRIYRDALRQVSAHLLILGEERWLEFVRDVQTSGRKRFVEVERSLLCSGDSTDLAMRSASKGSPGQTTQLTNLALRVLTAPESYVMSAQGYLVGERATVGASLRDLRKQLAPFMSPREFSNAVNELHSDLFLLVVDGDTVIANEAPRYINAGVCRYRF